MVEVLGLLVIALAVYAISKLLSAYDGPFDVFKILREKFPMSPLVCAVCTAVWVAIPFSIFSGISFLDYFAVIGIVILLEVKL